MSVRTHDGLPLRLLVIVDEFTRECLAVDVARKLMRVGGWDRMVPLHPLYAKRGQDVSEIMRLSEDCCRVSGHSGITETRITLAGWLLPLAVSPGLGNARGQTTPVLY